MFVYVNTKQLLNRSMVRIALDLIVPTSALYPRLVLLLLIITFIILIEWYFWILKFLFNFEIFNLILKSAFKFYSVITNCPGAEESKARSLWKHCTSVQGWQKHISYDQATFYDWKFLQRVLHVNSQICHYCMRSALVPHFFPFLFPFCLNQILVTSKIMSSNKVECMIL